MLASKHEFMILETSLISVILIVNIILDNFDSLHYHK